MVRRRVVTFRIEDEVYRAIEEYIQSSGYWETFSDFVRWLIRMYFTKKVKIRGG